MLISQRVSKLDEMLEQSLLISDAEIKSVENSNGVYPLFNFYKKIFCNILFFFAISGSLVVAVFWWCESVNAGTDKLATHVL